MPNSLWINDSTGGLIIGSSNKVVYCGDCPCPPGTGTTVVETFNTCSNCSNAAKYFELTVAGIADGTNCLGCNRANGTFVLVYTKHPSHGSGCSDNDCIWDTLKSGLECCTDIETGDCCGATGLVPSAMWRLFIGATDAELTLRGWVNPAFCSVSSVYAKWKLATGSFDCDGPNTLTLDSSDTSLCDSYPSTLTLTPTTEPTMCP